jgi:hypothetical protein
MQTKSGLLAARRQLAAALLALALCACCTRSLAAAPPEDPRFRWTEAVEALSPRDVPNRLSRPSGPVTSSATRARSALALDWEHYPTSAEVVTFTQQLQALYPRLVQTVTLGASWQARPILALRLGNQDNGDPAARPAMYLDGQHHAREPISQQVVLYTAWYLLANYGSDPLVTHLLDTRTVYAVPSVNLDGNDIFLSSDFSQRRTANPGCCDDDADGALDEDPANGMGYGTYMLYRYRFDQAWADLHPDDPFASGWQDHQLDWEYVGVFDGQSRPIPQLDDDQDGSVNEDPSGGVDANRNYDLHWDQGDARVWSPGYRGPQPFSEPETRAVRDLIQRDAHIVTGLSYHSGADLILHPWAWSQQAALPDALVYEMLSRKGSQLTEGNGFRGAPHAWAARGLQYTASGTTLDWLYQQGIYAWSPEVYGASAIAFTQRIGASASFTVGLSSGVGQNPDPAAILPVVQRWNAFNLYVLAASPHLELTGVSAQDGLLTLQVANDGWIPVAATAELSWEGAGAVSATLGDLSAGERALSFVYAPRPSQTVTITLTAGTRVGTAARVVESQEFRLAIAKGQPRDTVTVLYGRLGEFVDWGRCFGPGGWLAGAEWDLPGIYHLGPPLLQQVFLPLVRRGSAAHGLARP